MNSVGIGDFLLKYFSHFLKNLANLAFMSG